MADDEENVRTLWTVAAEDVRFHKGQQYSLVNYCMLLLGAIVAVTARLIPPDVAAFWTRLLMVVAGLAVGALACWQIYYVEKSLVIARKAEDLSRRVLAGKDALLAGILTDPDIAKQEPPDVNRELVLLIVAAWGVTVLLIWNV